ncbi:hypothetical protein J6590_031919 [Homalodisca vitripennis]|nr:hypothetical protein J6590_031919 [Homalodisca vitripennis]
MLRGGTPNVRGNWTDTTGSAGDKGVEGEGEKSSTTKLNWDIRGFTSKRRTFRGLSRLQHLISALLPRYALSPRSGSASSWMGTV